MTVSICTYKLFNVASSCLVVLLLYICWSHANEDDISHLTSHPGHLKPFGQQGRNIEVSSVDSFPSPELFFRKYVNANKPLLIRGGAKISPAFKLWTDDYFLNLAESKTHKVMAEQGKKEDRSLATEDLFLHEFIHRYTLDQIYMVHSVPDFLAKDVYFPPCLLCPEILKYLLDKVMWFSSGGTKSVFHYDSAENINCLFAGEKILYMVDYKDSDRVTIENLRTAYSNVDVERVDLVKYPGLKDLDFYKAEMKAGDCLYIPYHWYHHVLSINRNIAVNIWWSPSAKPQLHNCTLQNITIDKLTFLGFQQLFPRELVDVLKNVMKVMFKEFENKVNFEQFVQYFATKCVVFEQDADWSPEMIQLLEQSFNHFDESSKDSFLTPKDIELMSTETWDKVVPIFRKINVLVDEQFEQYSEEDSHLGPEDSRLADEEYPEHEKTEL